LLVRPAQLRDAAGAGEGGADITGLQVGTVFGLVVVPRTAVDADPVIRELFTLDTRCPHQGVAKGVALQRQAPRDLSRLEDRLLGFPLPASQRLEVTDE